MANTNIQEVAPATNEFEKILSELTSYTLEQKVKSFDDLVKYASDKYDIAGINVVSTKTTYFAELVK